MLPGSGAASAAGAGLAAAVSSHRLACYFARCKSAGWPKKMKYYPIFLRIDGKVCLVVGGGAVATQKVESLLAAHAAVRVVSPRLTPRLRELAERAAIEWCERVYHAGDLEGVFLVVAATSDENLHESIHREAERAGVLLNVVDRPRWCGFIVPSIARRGDLTVAVSTGGACPALARKVRLDIERLLGPEYERALELLSRLRLRLRGQKRSFAARQEIFDRLLASPLLENLRRGDAAAVDRLLTEHVGEGITVASLGERPD
jgi:precorrin-2 dehydrogenase/sirohydrochlorin ferrochelatase